MFARYPTRCLHVHEQIFQLSQIKGLKPHLQPQKQPYSLLQYSHPKCFPWRNLWIPCKLFKTQPRQDPSDLLNASNPLPGCVNLVLDAKSVLHQSPYHSINLWTSLKTSTASALPAFSTPASTPKKSSSSLF